LIRTVGKESTEDGAHARKEPVWSTPARLRGGGRVRQEIHSSTTKTGKKKIGRHPLQHYLEGSFSSAFQRCGFTTRTTGRRRGSSRWARGDVEKKEKRRSKKTAKSLF